MWKVRWIRLKNHVKKTDPMSTRANVTKCSLNVLLMSPPSAMQTWRMESPIRPFAQVTSLERRMAAEPSTHGTQVKMAALKTGVTIMPKMVAVASIPIGCRTTQWTVNAAAWRRPVPRSFSTHWCRLPNARSVVARWHHSNKDCISLMTRTSSFPVSF